MEKKFKATVALAISVAGAVGTMGLAKTGFLGGMIHNGFLAATIGGMADWFAVTALFRKPLGISYRTEIIVRNRERIMQAVVDFAANDLLGADNVMKFVRQQDLSVFLRDFLQTHTEDKLLPAVENVAGHLQDLDCHEMAQQLASGIHDSLVRQQAAERMARELLHGLSDEEAARRILRVLSEAGEELLKDSELSELVARHADDLLREYGDANSSRAFVMALLGLTGEKVTDKLWKKAHNYLDSLTDDEEAERQAISYLSEKLGRLEHSEKAVQLVAEKLSDFISEEKLTGYLENALTTWLRGNALRSRLHQMAGEYINSFLANEAWQQKADAMLKNWLEHELREHHDVIVSMIEERLQRFSDAELVEFTEEKVADDLQMIRINGSVVGSLVGMLLFVLVYAVRQVTGS